MSEEFPAIWNPNRALEGVFCPKCDFLMDDYYGQPDCCPKCGVKLSGWVDGGKLEKEEKEDDS